MTDEDMEKIVGCLPIHQRKEARRRIRRACLDGVTDIGLWTGEEHPEIDDLTGNCPHKRAEYRAQGDDFSSGVVGLGKYTDTETAG